MYPRQAPRPSADVNSGVNTRELLKQRDPPLAALLAEVYGDGPLRYGHFAAQPFGGISPDPELLAALPPLPADCLRMGDEPAQHQPLVPPPHSAFAPTVGSGGDANAGGSGPSLRACVEAGIAAVIKRL